MRRTRGINRAHAVSSLSAYEFQQYRVKSLGEVALVGVAPAIANAIYHGMGRDAEACLSVSSICSDEAR